MMEESVGVPVPGIRERLRTALEWRDALWDSIFDGLQRRNPAAAHTALEMLARQPRFLYAGRSTSAAALVWSALDAEAREDWIWACEFNQRIWVRGVVGNRWAF